MSIWGVIFGIIGARALPRHHELEPGLGDPRALVRAVRGLVGRARDLGRDPVRRARGRLGRAALREQRAADDGRGRAGAPARAGDRPLGQLVEPGALRQAHDAALGARDPRQGAGRTRTTRPSSTSSCGTSSASRCCSGSTGASSSAGPALFALYVAIYTAFRMFEETLRIDPSSHFLGPADQLLGRARLLRRRASRSSSGGSSCARRRPTRRRPRNRARFPRGRRMAVPRGRVR